jgi:ATP-dependent Clp endopeptidase proteolytic subunit ClpP
MNFKNLKKNYSSKSLKMNRIIMDNIDNAVQEIENSKMDESAITMDRTPRGIEAEENRIYFYCPIGDNEALELNRMIRRLDVEMQYLSSRLAGPVVPIHLHIHSPGGSVFSGLSIVDTMLSCKTPIYTYVDGSAASAATLIACCGTIGHRYVGNHSFMLVHQPHIEWYGKLDDFRDEIQNQKELYEAIVDIYLKRTKFTREELEDLLQHELWLNAKTCIEKGLADRINE